MTRHTIDNDYFTQIDTEEKAYFLGLLGADGNVSKDRDRIEISLSGDEDRIVLERFKHALGFSGEIKRKKVNYPNAKPCYRLSFADKKIKVDLVRHGVVPCKSLIYEFNQSIPADLIRHYIRGYFDGDGSASLKQDGSFLLSITSSPYFIHTLSRVIWEQLQLSAHTEILKGNKTHSLKIGGNFRSFLFLDWIYKDSTIFLPRKKDKYTTCVEVVSDKLRNQHRFHNIFSHKEIMISAKRCADILGIPFDLSAYNGLSSDRSKQDEIMVLYGAGNSVRKVSRLIGTSDNLVKNTLIKNGIAIRPFRKKIV